jgi:hypothetical protein
LDMNKMILNRPNAKYTSTSSLHLLRYRTRLTHMCELQRMELTAIEGHTDTSNAKGASCNAAAEFLRSCCGQAQNRDNCREIIDEASVVYSTTLDGFASLEKVKNGELT